MPGLVQGQHLEDPFDILWLDGPHIDTALGTISRLLTTHPVRSGIDQEDTRFPLTHLTTDVSNETGGSCEKLASLETRYINFGAVLNAQDVWKGATAFSMHKTIRVSGAAKADLHIRFTIDIPTNDGPACFTSPVTSARKNTAEQAIRYTVSRFSAKERPCLL